MLPSTIPRARLLVADDQPDVLEALRLLLTQYGFSLQLVPSPGAVLEQLRAEPWDLLLMDLNYSRDTTSGAEGLRLVGQVRALDLTLPIVVMTGWGNIELAVDAMRAGAQSFVQKPWDNAGLVQILQREVTEGRHARQRSERHARDQHDGLLIQRALLPAALPMTDRFQVVGAWQPADGFGGDCYDAFMFGPERLGLSIADVAGKGLPAALLMSSLQAALRAFANEASPPHQICASVNRLLCGQMVSGRFATLCYVRLDVGAGRLTYANAGHNPPILVRATGEIERLQPTGVVLGVFPDATYVGGEAALFPGDRLLLYTDGITEAPGGAEDDFGQARLEDALIRHRHLDAARLHAAVLAEVTSYAAGVFHDDATLIAVAIS